MKPEPGELDRKVEMIEEESKNWPTWMKRAAGLVGSPESDMKGHRSDRASAPRTPDQGRTGEKT